jgi:hypothetical protein
MPKTLPGLELADEVATGPTRYNLADSQHDAKRSRFEAPFAVPFKALPASPFLLIPVPFL